MAVSNQAADEVDAAVDRAAMACMFNLRDVLEWVNDRLSDRALASEQFVGQSHQAGFHVAARLGNKFAANPVVVFSVLPPPFLIQISR